MCSIMYTSKYNYLPTIDPLFPFHGHPSTVLFVTCHPSESNIECCFETTSLSPTSDFSMFISHLDLGLVHFTQGRDISLPMLSRFIRNMKVYPAQVALALGQWLHLAKRTFGVKALGCMTQRLQSRTHKVSFLPLDPSTWPCLLRMRRYHPC